MKKKIYIAGKVSGLPLKDVALKFCGAAKQISALGFEFINPVDLVQNHLFDNPEIGYSAEGEIWSFAMKKCITALMECDGIYFLEDFKDSKGAMIEWKLSFHLGIKHFNDVADLAKWSN